MARVLVIDDDLVIAELIRATLAEAGHEPLAGPAESHPQLDVIVTDLVVTEGYDGAAARSSIARLRSRFPGIPILVCTAHLDASHEPDRLGADAVIAKPFDLDDLVRTVEALVRDRGR
ncbi:MAG: response regulator [Candidatus Limnocylindria bacterium]